MTKLVHAMTKMNSPYPGYVNVSCEDDGTFVLTVRGDPSSREGCYVCGYASDKGQPGRCTPGDAHCNNYCNMAPEKGPMQKHPLGCTQVLCGDTANVRLSAAEFEDLVRVVGPALVAR